MYRNFIIPIKVTFGKRAKKRMLSNCPRFRWLIKQNLFNGETVCPLKKYGHYFRYHQYVNLKGLIECNLSSFSSQSKS